MVLVVLILMPGRKQQLTDRSVASIVEVYDVTLEWRVDWTYMGTIFVSALVPHIPSVEQPVWQ